jgi:transcriptional regulator with XRE-family HTH domain
MEARRLVGMNVRRIRVDAGIAQDDLALRAGVDRAYVGRLERGDANPTVVTLAKLAKALKVDLEHFFKAATRQDPAVLKGGRPPRTKRR